MYCGSCLRDNAMATELIARGHDVMLLPVYTPTLTDEPNVSQRSRCFRRHQRLPRTVCSDVSQDAALARSHCGIRKLF